MPLTSKFKIGQTIVFSSGQVAYIHDVGEIYYVLENVDTGEFWPANILKCDMECNLFKVKNRIFIGDK